MKLYLISNNLVIDNIVYQTDLSIEEKRINRPLAIEGEKKAYNLAKVLDGQAIYTSHYASAIASSKYLAAKLNIPIYIDANLKDSVIGSGGKNNIKMLRYMQERNFNYKYAGGESLNETRLRMKKALNNIIKSNEGDVIIFSHKRAILSYLLDYTKQGFNLDDRLILTYHDEVIMDDTENDIDIIELELEDNNIINIKNIELGKENIE